VEKTPIYIFSTFGSKINKFERKKSEKIEHLNYFDLAVIHNVLGNA
jgi:hypothetical protein